MRILLLGGGGFLGINLARALLLVGHEVHLLDRVFKEDESLINRNLILKTVNHVLSTSDREGVLAVVDDYKIECVVNLVSTLLPSSTLDEFVYENLHNVQYAVGLIDDFADRSVKYVYISSGGAVYGHSENSYVSENETKSPISYYGLSKLIFEEHVLFASRTRGLKYLIVRPSNPYGPFQSPKRKQGLISVVVDKIMKGEQIQVWGDGTVLRDYVWVEDFSNALSRLVSIDCWNRSFNIGSGIGYSVKQVIELIQSSLGVPANVSYTNSRFEDVSRIVLNIKEIKSVINYQPIDLPEGIDRYIRLVNDSQN